MAANTQSENTRVVNKIFAVLSEILSEKYGVKITMRAIPKNKAELPCDDERSKKEE